VEKFQQRYHGTRLSQEDLQEIRRAAIPVWYRWADKTKTPARSSNAAQYMMNDTVG